MASTIWRGYITFGLISIPVRLFRAARAERVSFKRMYRDISVPESDAEGQVKREEAPAPSLRWADAKVEPFRTMRRPNVEQQERPEPEGTLVPVKQVSVRKGTDEVVAQQKIVKGYEYDKNRFVAIEPEELKSIAPKTATQMEIEEFVQFAEIDPVYLETSYYVMPEQAGEKAYALLFKALETTGLVALAQFAMHNREHVVIVRPSRHGLIAHTIFFASEVRAEDEYRTNTELVSRKELELAQSLIHSLSGPFQPERYRDTYREKLEEIIARKVSGQPVQAIEPPSRSGTVVDITDALRRSLAALKKTPGKEERVRPKENDTPPSTPKGVTRRKTAGH
jgi:DNA end-binding protein Ku